MNTFPEQKATDPGSVRGMRRHAAPMLVATGLVMSGVLLFAVDVPIALWFREHRLPGDLARLVDLGEVFGHALSVALILIVMVSLDPVLRQVRRVAAVRWEVARLVLATYAGGIVVDGLKLAFTRVRPRATNYAGVESFVETFGTAAWQLAGVDMPGAIKKSSDLMSFPSGHSAVAAGLATVLAWRYPHGWPIFALLAALAGLQRIVSSAHYPSDVAFGAACGVAMATVCLAGSRSAKPVLP
jgi:membrane-associated phospholipid phosphatase